MKTPNFFIDKSTLPFWFKYPDGFLKIIEYGLTNLTPWYILSDDLLEWRYSGLKERYPKRSLIPFAARYDNDDIACWDKINPHKVIIIHDFADENWEFVAEYETFWDWFKIAIDDMIDY